MIRVNGGLYEAINSDIGSRAAEMGAVAPAMEAHRPPSVPAARLDQPGDTYYDSVELP